MLTTFAENKNVFSLRLLLSLMANCHASTLTWFSLTHWGFFPSYFFFPRNMVLWSLDPTVWKEEQLH